jgi:peptidoglycan/LPS O-acetylase OafA/YrhL
VTNTDPIDPAQLFAKRIPSLDGLRALAITAVMIGHVSPSKSYVAVMGLPGLVWLRYLLGWTMNPSVGVHLFFTLSGFLITWLLLSEEHRTARISLPKFYLRRSLRILPVYWCFLIVAELMHTLRPTIAGSPFAFVESLTFTMGWWPDDPFLLGHTWSLSVEETFYLLWPLVLCYVSGPARWRVGWCVVMVVPLVRVGLVAFGQTHYATFTVLGTADAIMWGCLAAMTLWRWPVRVRRFAGSHATAGRALAFAVIILCNASDWNLHHRRFLKFKECFT